MCFRLRRTVTAVFLLGGALLLMGSTPSCLPSPPTRLHESAGDRATSWPAWLPDGSAILFSRYTQGTFVVDVAGTRLQQIPESKLNGDEVPVNKSGRGNMSAALSPDGSRVAYVGMVGYYPTITIAALDGMDETRFTHALDLNHSPVWSPDGSQIAYVSDGSLTIADADGSNERLFEQAGTAYPPRWSPDGRWIALIGSVQTRGGMVERSHYEVVTLVRTDGSGLTTLEAVGGVSHENQREPAIPRSYLTVLGSLASMPAWSPDGSQIAFFQAEQGSVVLYTVALSAALQERPIEARKVLSIDIESVPDPLAQEWIWYTTLSWSPDGTALLFASEHTHGHVVSVADGSVLANVGPGWAAWSPDGTRIAVVTSGGEYETENGKALHEVLYTMARDGTDKQVLVRGDLERFVAARAE